MHPDDTRRAIQEARHSYLETDLSPVRLMGDALVSAYFAGDNAKSREKARSEVESFISGKLPRWDLLEASVKRLRSEHGILPFHWSIEFPEIFERENGGFDAIFGNPPFLGGSYITRSYGVRYFSYLGQNFAGCVHHCDYVGYFVRRDFDL